MKSVNRLNPLQSSLGAVAVALGAAVFLPIQDLQVMAQGIQRPIREGLGSNNTFFVPWRDPRENAFELGVPAGWQVQGGTMRAAAVDVRYVVQAQSPDGSIRVFLDDPNLPPRQVPDMLTLQAGLREGQVIQGAWGGPLLLARYQTGEQFARQHISQRLCPGAQILQSGPLVSASRDMNARIQPMAMAQRIAAQADIGEAYFRCGPGVGYTFATTLRVAASGYGTQFPLWVVFQLASVVVTDPAQAGFGAYVMHTMLETFALNPQWEARQAQLTQDVTGSVTRMQQEMARSVAQYSQRQASAGSAGGFNHPNDGRLPTDLRAKWAGEDRLSQQRQDATMGQKWMHTPWGENVRVDNSHSIYWIDHNKNVVAGPPDGNPPTGSQGQYTQLLDGWRR